MLHIIRIKEHKSQNNHELLKGQHLSKLKEETEKENDKADLPKIPLTMITR